MDKENKLYFREGCVIISWYEWPPGPCSPFYRACIDGEEEYGEYGMGPTRESAVEDLLENLGVTND